MVKGEVILINLPWLQLVGDNATQLIGHLFLFIYFVLRVTVGVKFYRTAFK